MKLNKFKKIINTLLLENCLTFGNDPKGTSKRVTKYLLGTRGTTEIFKLYELRSLLLRVYPLIHNIFYNPRLSSEIKTETFNVPNLSNIYHLKKRQLRTTGYRGESKPWTKTISFWRERAKTLPPQILFATVTLDLADIIQSAAKICNMPFHKNRWWNGSITASASATAFAGAPDDSLVWNYLQDFTQSQIDSYYQAKWGINKENPQKTKERIRYHGRSRWPSLLVVPDISKNTMILTEAKKRGLPIIGLVNSDCTLEIDYPIFAQDQTVENVYFFCHFLATLIAKEMVYIQHKRYALQKNTNQNKKGIHVKNPMLQKRQLRFEKLNKFKQREASRKKIFFFETLRPQQTFFSSSKVPFWKSFWRSFRRKEPYKNYRLKMNYIKLVQKVLCYWNYSHSSNSSNSKEIKKTATNYISFRNIFLKDQRFLYRWSLTENLIRSETQQKYFGHKRECFWTAKEKTSNWNRIWNFLFVKKMIKKQVKRKKYSFQSDASNNPYYWLVLHQWVQDIKWHAPFYRNLKAIVKHSPSYKTIRQDWLESARKRKEHQAEVKKLKAQGKFSILNFAFKFKEAKSKNYNFKKRHGKRSRNYKH